MSTTLTGGLGLKKTSITDTVTQMVDDMAANVEKLDKIWPIGSIYMSVNSTNPSTFLGGSWARLENRFLVGAGSDFAAGTTGGQKDMGIHLCGDEASGYGLPEDTLGFRNRVIVNGANYTGKVLPPYLSVYMWKRTA